MYAKFIALAALISTAVALPGGNPPPTNTQICSTGAQACCNQLQTIDHPSVKQALQGSGFSLADLQAAVGSVNAPIGLNCSPVTVIGAGGNSCNAQATCCNNNNFNGAVALGCNPINVNA